MENVLAATKLLYAGELTSTRLYIHALVINSYILSAYRLIDGRSKIASLQSQIIRKKNGKMVSKAEVVSKNI